MHPNCRCSIAAYEDSEEYETWLDYLDKGGTTADWNKFGKAAWMDSNVTKPLANAGGSSTINSIKKAVQIPDDCDYILKADTNLADKDVDADVLRIINKAIGKGMSASDDFRFDEIKVAKFKKDDKSVFVTDCVVVGGRKTIILYLNEKFFVGKTAQELNSMAMQYYDNGWWNSKTLEDLVNHEIMHSKIGQQNSYEKAERLYETLKDDSRIKGLCRLVDEHPDEFLNEVYVAMCNGKHIDPKYVAIFEEYAKEFLGG